VGLSVHRALDDARPIRLHPRDQLPFEPEVALVAGAASCIHVTAVDGASPFEFIAAAMEGVLGLARAAALEIPPDGGDPSPRDHPRDFLIAGSADTRAGRSGGGFSIL
jgi:hypothetical protein